ncbi:MAG: ComF family protein [Ignavibacteriaceae bacterium]|nr:ComF family protein [Ignavibacteriaceae bacterium]
MRDDILHLFYPRVCPGCGSQLYADAEGICPECISAFDAFGDADASGYAIMELFRRNYPDDTLSGKAWALYRFHKNDRLQRVIHAMKYEGVSSLGKVFGRFLGEMIAGCGGDDLYSCVVPVPLHRLKVFDRTYNQSEIIARSVASVLRKDFRNDLVVRKKYTRSQAGLSWQERLRNVRDAFEPSGRAVPKSILLVDDVLTTGATVSAVKNALESEGAEHISLATIALAG